ncbi:hypothetical protein PV325_004417 [Microctonus aethiopoides]|nr:hypothetical protein PV325_004417 [Microctonus aethiopoides]
MRIASKRRYPHHQCPIPGSGDTVSSSQDATTYHNDDDDDDNKDNERWGFRWASALVCRFGHTGSTDDSKYLQRHAT